MMVLKQMELADVKPDSQTLSYLISNCDREEDIIKVDWNLCFGQGFIFNLLLDKVQTFLTHSFDFCFLGLHPIFMSKSLLWVCVPQNHVSFFFIVKNRRSSTDLS